MPNWCWNRLAITGPEETVAEALESVAAEATPDTRLDPEFGTTVSPSALSLEKIKPTPEDLVGSKTDPMAPFELLYNEPGPGQADDWYTWRVRNWGTKWDVDAEIEKREPGEAHLAFDSAWSPPVPAVVALSERFPDLEFLLTFDEPGNDFAGHRLIQRGAIIEAVDTNSPQNHEEEP
jgi:hypothetical protein